MRWYKMNVADSIAISVRHLCDQCPKCLLGIRPNLGPIMPGDNLTDAAWLLLTQCTETQTAPSKTKQNSSLCEKNSIKHAK